MRFVDFIKDNGKPIAINPELVSRIDYVFDNESKVYFGPSQFEYIKGSIQEIKEKMLKV